MARIACTARRSTPHAATAITLAATLSNTALASSANASSGVELNTATEAELDSVRGIGPDLSARLLAERAKAPFRDWADLIARVKPMGPAQAQRLSEAGLRVNGQPYRAQER